MIEVTNKSELVPENDLQELWKLAGRVEALRGLLKAKEEKNGGNNLVYVSEILAILGK